MITRNSVKRIFGFALALVLCLALCPATFAAQVMLSPQKLKVYDEYVTCEKYNIDGSNYFKLRDLAYVLNGTACQFDVGWDAAAGVVSIETGKAYEKNGSELVVAEDKSSTAQPSAQTIKINGVVCKDLSVYNIGGNNFFKLRDLGAALNFDVGYDAATNTALVMTKVMMFAPDGRTCIVWAGQVPDYQAVGWYPYGVMLNRSSATVLGGYAITLSATVRPESAAAQAVTWASSDANVASVSSNGIVTAKNGGTATITAIVPGGMTAKCMITVPKSVAVSTFVNLNQPVMEKVTASVGKVNDALNYFKLGKYASVLASSARADGEINSAIELCGNTAELSGMKRVLQSIHTDYQTLSKYSSGNATSAMAVVNVIQKVLPKYKLLTFESGGYNYSLLYVYDGPTSANPTADYTFVYLCIQNGSLYVKDVAYNTLN